VDGTAPWHGEKSTNRAVGFEMGLARRPQVLSGLRRGHLEFLPMDTVMRAMGTRRHRWVASTEWLGHQMSVSRIQSAYGHNLYWVAIRTWVWNATLHELHDDCILRILRVLLCLCIVEHWSNNLWICLWQECFQNVCWAEALVSADATYCPPIEIPTHRSGIWCALFVPPLKKNCHDLT